jgi:hypothetical protein
MRDRIVLMLFFFGFNLSFVFAQTKVSGIIVDKSNQPIPFANVVFKNSRVFENNIGKRNRLI